MKRFQWKILPQGMLNSPTMYQLFVARTLLRVRTNFPDCCIIHYMHDILCAAPPIVPVTTCFEIMKKQLDSAGLYIVPNEIQTTTPVQYLGTVVDHQSIKPQKVQMRRD